MDGVRVGLGGGHFMMTKIGSGSTEEQSDGTENPNCAEVAFSIKGAYAPCRSDQKSLNKKATKTVGQVGLRLLSV